MNGTVPASKNHASALCCSRVPMGRAVLVKIVAATRLPQASGYKIGLAHFNQRHHRVLYTETFGLEFFGCTRRFDTKRVADPNAYCRTWPGDDEAIPASQPPAA